MKLSVSLTPSETCETATPLAAGAAVDVGAAGATVPSPCTGSNPARYYRVAIPAGSVGTITLTRNGTNNASAWLSTDCSHLRCDLIAQRDTSAGPAVWTYGNAGPAERDFILAVSSSRPTAPGDLTLAFATRAAPGYVLATAATPMCDVLDAPVHISLRGDDVVTPPIAMPFAFDFYGVARTHYAVSTNGLLQFVAASGAGSTAYGHTMLPLAAAPRDLVAAYWQDLVGDASSFTHSQVFGAAPGRRLVVEWSNYLTYARTRITFQARLDEGSHQIQVSFCNVSHDPTSDLTISSATIGLQNADGTVGHLAAYNDRDAVVSTRRYTFSVR